MSAFSQTSILPAAERPQPLRQNASFGFRALALLTVSAVGLLGLTGCGVSRLIPPSEIAAIPHLRGVVHGGQQPVYGASINLYSVGTIGNMQAVTASLLNNPVTTDQDGSFSITGDYTCPTGSTQVYIAATGGDSGFGGGSGQNFSLALVTALGSCGSLSSSSFITINEVTTAAAAYALAPFAFGVEDISASPTNDAGMARAMEAAKILADPATGIAPAANFPSGSATTETAKLYSLANLLAACVNSDGTSTCSTIFSHAAQSFTLGGPPTDTFQLALQIAQSPGFNVSTLFNDIPAQAVFGGGLSVAPNDWTMSVTYTGGGLNQPAGIAIDAGGNLWVANQGGSVSNFSAQGVTSYPSGITGGGLNNSVGITIDSSAGVWVTNPVSDAMVNGGHGSVTKILDSNGALESGAAGYTAGGINNPAGTAADPGGNIWVADGSGGVVTLYNSSGVAQTLGSFVSSSLVAPIALAVAPGQTVWVADITSGNLVQFDMTGAALFTIPSGIIPGALALDSAANVWAVASSTTTSLVQANSGGAMTPITGGGGLNLPVAIAVDGGDSLWITNSGTAALSQFAGTASPQGVGNAISPATGFGLDAQMTSPFGVAVDPSGTVWVTDNGSNHLVAFVGLAVPVSTPLMGVPTAP